MEFQFSFHCHNMGIDEIKAFRLGVLNRSTGCEVVRDGTSLSADGRFYGPLEDLVEVLDEIALGDYLLKVKA